MSEIGAIDGDKTTYLAGIVSARQIFIEPNNSRASHSQNQSYELKFVLKVKENTEMEKSPIKFPAFKHFT